MDTEKLHCIITFLYSKMVWIKHLKPKGENMGNIINRDNFNFLFSRKIKPVLTIESRDEITFHTRDAHNGTVPAGGDVHFPDIDLKECNPVTGPVYIKDAKPGDMLLVTIRDIKLDGKGFVPARQKMGIIHNLVEADLARNMAIKDGLIHFSDKIKIPIRPMIGTIGVAPADKEIYSAYAGTHGGNMDNNDVWIGSKLYLPVFVDGALLSVGDVHASMGDGELTSGGIDINAEVVLQTELIKNAKINWPVIETGDAIITTSNSDDFYEANKIAALEMINLLTRILGVTKVEAYWLISIIGDLKISQACGLEIGLNLRLSFPKIGRLSDQGSILQGLI